MKLVSYSDADYTRYRDTYKSTYRIVFLFASRVITLQSKKQTLVVQSTTKAEYYRIVKAVIEAI